GLDEAQFDGFSRQQTHGPMVVSGGHRTARDGDQMGRLSTSQGLAISCLALVVQYRLQPAFQIQLSYTNGGVAADIKGRADLLVGPALVGFEQDACSGESASIGFARMDEGVQGCSLAFGQCDSDGMLHEGSPVFS